ncbi:MAG TPA: hypothetical protein VFZ12_02660 [Dehalococcoidia bacterium]|nr:hypothetical protein [Dehalococcoidia bacterium]
MQWKEWLNTARRATTRSEPGRRSRPHTATPIRITPSVLTICREHGPAELHVKGPEASTSSVLFSPRYFDVARGKFSAGDQVFSVRLTGQFPERDRDASLKVRNGQLVRRVPVYEFSCPTSEGSCAFAS